ncbi:MAG: alpha/beta fold hydrolase [Acidimicrobiia bacterium]
MPPSAPISHRFLAPSGLSLAVHDWGGAGDPVLLAHPTGFHGRAWAAVASELVDAGRKVWSFDFRGHGDSDPSPGARYQWQEFAEDALAVTHHLDLAGVPELLVAGHSKGGASLLWGAVREPGVYARVWSYEPIIVPSDTPMLAAADNPLSEGARRRRTTWPSREEALENYGSKPPLNALAPASLAAYVDYGLRDRPDGTVELKCRPEDEAQMYMMGASLGLFPELGQVECPVLVACGGTTQSITPAMTELIAARIPNASVEVWAGRGHFGPLEDPEQAAASMLRFAVATA